jgi:hypothetical protein
MAVVIVRFVLFLICALASAKPVADKHYRVLVLHSFRNSLPVNMDWYRGIVGGFESASDLRIDVDIESLDRVTETSGAREPAATYQVGGLGGGGWARDGLTPSTDYARSAGVRPNGAVNS